MSGIRSGNALVQILIACALGGAVVTCPSLAATEQKVALIIGNSGYPTARLKNPVNDANAMAEKLRALGFDVILKTDASQRDMTRAFSQFGQKLAVGSVGLFYYAGHGMQVQGRNFLIPVDAEIENEASVHSEAVDVDQVLRQLGPARLSMVILDACRNNPFERRYRSVSGGLAQIDAPTGTLLAYATAPGKVASDGNGSNGLYTTELLRAMDMPGLRVEDIFKQVRINVLKASDSQQIPWESSSLTGEFYFRPASKTAVDNARLQQAEKERTELVKEMEKLRSELARLGALPVANTVLTPPAGGTSQIESKPVSEKVAIAAPPVTSPPGVSFADEWSRRTALLEKSRGQLNFAKAVAILLDINSAEDLALLLTHEGTIKRLSWQSAYAIGADRNGNLIWGGSRSWRNADQAIDTAVEYCSGTAGKSCKAVMMNGEFREKDFLDAVKQFGVRNVAETRQAYLQTLTRIPEEIRVTYSAGGGGGGASYGFASLR